MDGRQFAKLLIPVKKAHLGKGIFRWPARPILASPRSVDVLPLEQLSRDLKEKNIKASVDRNTLGQAAVKVNRDKKIGNDEAYRLAVTPDGIEVYAKADAGAYYALQTLRDLVSIYGKVLPACVIEDKPDFRRRGIYHDCSRGKVPKLATLKDLVERLAHWKINELELYVENVFAFKQHPDIGKGYSPFTAEEILSLQECCRAHHIKLVGSLASFGHFEKILSLPKYRDLGEMPGFRGFPGGTTLCPTDPRSIKLISELYSEFVPLFEAEDFNVCCDETLELGKGRSKERATQIGAGEVYLEFLLKIHRLCEKYGKRMNAWADMVLKYPELLKKLPREMVLLNWEYESNGENIGKTGEIAKSGMRFMVCPGTSGWLTHGSRMANSMGNVRNFTAAGRRYNAEGLLNTDWGDRGHHNFLGASLHSFAHGAAHSWNSRAVDEKRFTENFCYHVFGQKTNKMAKKLTLLGNTYSMCGKPVRNKSLLYDALVEPLLHTAPPAQSCIDMTKPAGLRRILDKLSDGKGWPEASGTTEVFEKTALRELKAAERMDCLACRRALAAKALRAGKDVNKSELMQLGKSIKEMSEEFEELWLLRNKTSRLKDNMKLFKQVERESYHLADKKKRL
ncbi:MAG: glycoside hydrolase family 20 zincin-like fold domain-containing protein [Phycisphaerae bacterium]|nr:glycoside hydrolase family 20 zincin-like fold domain-containing protein [Phycisphaerae bacterium]MDD5381040.1 glycoside hydrolase family 20 zincin-like fold domain-containing protein [Phycisphaerae bacterium]